MAVGGGRQYKPPNVALFFWLQGAIDIRSVSPNPFSPASRLCACHDGAGRASGAAFARVDAWSSPRIGKFWRFCFGVYGFALQNPKQFAGFLERFIGDWLPPFEQALGAAGFPPERARSLATLSLAAMRGLQLDAIGERARIDAAFREILALLTLASRGAPNESTRRAARKKHRSTAATGLEQDGQRTIVGGPARAKRRRH
jgi:hypothetical protein